MDFTFVVGDLDPAGGGGNHHAVDFGQDDLAAVARHAPFHAGAHQRSVSPDQRHCLALHVGPHERPVGVVMLQKRDQRGRDAHDLHG